MNRFYDYTATSLEGEEIKMARYRGRTILVVNTASKCGFTPQYTGLQELYERYHGQGLEILGFPCNQFGYQEPGDAHRIREGCLTDYGVTFQMFDKIEVNGANAHPLFTYLKNAKPGLLGRPIRWNFTKFLLDVEGNPVRRFSPRTTPASIDVHIKKLLVSQNTSADADA